MMKAACVTAALFASQAFAQLPVPVPTLPVPGIPGLPGVPSLPTPGLTGSTSVTANGMGVVVTVDSSQTPPATVTPVGLPALPGLP